MTSARKKLVEAGEVFWQECETIKVEEWATDVTKRHLKCPLCARGVVVRTYDATPGFKESEMTPCSACGLRGDGASLRLPKARGLPASIITAFTKVAGRPYVPTTPDDWTKPAPATFNCSSFVQWLALAVLGWGRPERSAYRVANVRALLSEFDWVEGEGALRSGDALIYSDNGDRDGNLHAMVLVGRELVVGACDQSQTVTMRAAEYEAGWTLLCGLRIAKRTR